MYAVIRSGGKQYKVTANDVISVETLAGTAGATIEFTEVLMVGGGGKTAVGAPLVEGAKVMAKVLEQARGDKIVIFKKKRRKNYRRRTGHRQNLTVVRIGEIVAGAAA